MKHTICRFDSWVSPVKIIGWFAPRPEEDRLFKDDLAGWSSLKSSCWDLRVLVGRCDAKKTRFLIAHWPTKKLATVFFFLLRGWFRGSKDVGFQPWIGYLLDLGCQIAAGQAWPRSGHTGSLLPDMLRGKSPCLWAESATGRPEDLDSGADIEAHAELWFLGFGPLQQQSYAMSVWKNANWTGLTLSMPPSCRCWTEMALQVSFDLKFWMMIPRGSFLLLRLQAIQCQSNMHDSDYRMWLLLFLTSWFLKFSNIICQQLLVRFWFGRLHGICSFLGGRTSMATQRTHRELAPRYAAGKVPVPLGRECHWETRRPWLWSRHRNTCWVVVLGLWSFAAAKLCHERLKERQLNGAHSFHASLLRVLDRDGIASQFWLEVLDDDTTW